jgi:Mycothiol maleylpyruvate isomerase N-terminal domain
MYLDSLEFLEEERDTWAPFEALASLTDEQLATPVGGAHGWSGRQLMAHLLAWQEIALAVATELAVNETSPALARSVADQEGRGIDAINAEMAETWASRSVEEIRERFRTLPGELRGYLTVVPESRWLKHPRHLRSFQDDTTGHYEEHQSDLAAVLAAARG